MNLNLRKRFASAVAAGAMIVNLATPAFAATTIEISGNGSDSDSTVTTAATQSTTVFQSNVSNVSNNVDADASTGGNRANDNTGGDVSVDTGDARVLVDVANNLNTNTAEVDCCEAFGDTDVLVAGNGSDSDNTVNLRTNNNTTLVQSNYADVDNRVDADAKTGRNDAGDNTGGDVSIDTGNATVGVSLSTSANANTARIGGGNGEEGGLSVRILGNGSESDNDINLALESETELFQANVADVFNRIEADALTGENDADDNTGGNVGIDTGNALVGVEVDNMVNFNWADVDCGCLFDVLAKISGNGSDSDNEIKASLYDNLLVAQENGCEEFGGPVGALFNEGPRGGDCEVDNNVDANAKTGYNEAEDSTGEADGDPWVDTGDASAGVELENSGNVNVYGEGFELPDFDFDFDFGMNWAFMWAMFSGLSN